MHWRKDGLFTNGAEKIMHLYAEELKYIAMSHHISKIQLKMNLRSKYKTRSYETSERIHELSAQDIGVSKDFI